MPTTMARDDSEKGFCPLFDSVLKADDRRSGYETPVQRTRAIESITDNAQDRSFPPSEVAFEERPKKSLLQNLSRITRGNAIDPTAVLWLDRAGDVHVLTRALESPRKVPRTILTRGFRQKLSNPDYEFELEDSDAEDDLDLEDSLSETEKARNTPSARRRGPNKGHSTKRRNTSPAPGSAERRKRSTQDQVLNDGNDEEDFELDVVDEFEGAQTELKGLRVDSLEDWYDFAFRSMSQLALKDIAKAWIRICVPKKQSTNPYNGGRRAAESLARWPGTNYTGHFTKAIWWPKDVGWDDIDGATGCRHREPDHIKKHERLILVKHLLRYGHEFMIELMRESTSKLNQRSTSSDKEFPPRTMDRLAEIYRVRENEMRYENSDIDGDTIVTVSMPKPKQKAKGKRKASLKTTSKHAGSMKAESPQTEASVQQAAPAPVANMGLYADMIAAQVEADERGDGAAVVKDSDNDTDRSILPDSTSSSVVEVAPPEKVDLLTKQYDARAPSHGLPTRAQLEEIAVAQPYKQYGLEVPNSFVPNARSKPPVGHHGISELAAHEQAHMVPTNTLPFGHATAFGGQHAAKSRHDTSTVTSQSSASNTNDRIQRGHLHGQRMNLNHRYRPSRVRVPHDASGTQAHVARLSPPPRPAAPRVVPYVRCPPAFPESSGLDTMTPSWVNEQAMFQQENTQYRSIYNEGANPNAVLLPSPNTSFSSDMTSSTMDSFGGTMLMDPQNPIFMPMTEQAHDQVRQQYPDFLWASYDDMSTADQAAYMLPLGSATVTDAPEMKYNPCPSFPEHRY